MLSSVLLLAVATSWEAWAIDAASLQRGPRGFWHLVLPSEMQEALRDSFPGFQAWPDSAYSSEVRRKFVYGEHAAPFAVITDLNNDGFEDVAIDGHDRRGGVVLVVVSRGNRYRAVKALRNDYGPVRPRGGLSAEVRVIGSDRRCTIWWRNEPFVRMSTSFLDMRGTSGFQYSDSNGVSYTLAIP